MLVMGCVSVWAQVINAGVSGNTSADLLKRLDRDVLVRHPHLVVVMVGTNDMLNSEKMLSYDEYEYNLNQMVRRIRSSGAEVVLMSPPPVDTVYLFQRHSRKLYADPPNMKLETIRRRMAQIAQTEQLGYLDIYQIFSDHGVHGHNEDQYIRNEQNSGVPDGVHPTALGYELIAICLLQYLKNQDILSEDAKIVCFGDSITYGAGVEHGGTIQGENYPAVLSALLGKSTNKK